MVSWHDGKDKLAEQWRSLVRHLPGRKAETEVPAETAAPEPLTDTELRVQ